MRDKTNLEGAKSVARCLAMVDLQLTRFSPMIVQHPFTSSGVVGVKSDEGMKILDIFTNKEDFKSWQSQLLEQINAAQSLHQIYTMINKPYALVFLKMAIPSLSRKDLSSLLADAWIRSENPNRDANFTKQELLSLFKAADPCVLMDEVERSALAALDENVVVYRGVTSFNARNIRALSWTLDRKTAEWFAHRFNENGVVYKATISKKHILALFDRRNETEVIVEPRYLTEISKT